MHLISAKFPLTPRPSLADLPLGVPEGLDATVRLRAGKEREGEDEGNGEEREGEGRRSLPSSDVRGTVPEEGVTSGSSYAAVLGAVTRTRHPQRDCGVRVIELFLSGHKKGAFGIPCFYVAWNRHRLLKRPKPSLEFRFYHRVRLSFYHLKRYCGAKVIELSFNGHKKGILGILSRPVA